MRASKKAFLYTTLDGIFPFQREAWFSSVLFRFGMISLG